MQIPTPEKPTEEANWAGPSGQRWLANATLFEAMLQPIGDALLQRAAPAAGEHIIDIGCGAGSMSLDIAALVGPSGSVTGLDISPALVAEGTRKAAAQNPKLPAKFVCADAARSGLPSASANCLLSRLGCMFFTDPYAAFVHLHSLIRPGGRLALACWAPLKQNPWMLEARTILASHFEFPAHPPRIPGPFAFDEPDYLRDILTQAGFTQFDSAPWQTQMPIGGPNSTPDSAADFLLHALSMAQRALDAPADLREKVRSQLSARLQTFNTPTGIQMPGSLWLTTAHA